MSRRRLQRRAKRRRVQENKRLARGVAFALLFVIVMLISVGEAKAHGPQIVSASQTTLAWYSGAPNVIGWDILVTRVDGSEDILAATPDPFSFCWVDLEFSSLLTELGVVDARINLRSVNTAGLTSEWSEALYVPEPSSKAMAIAGLAGLFWADRRARRQRRLQGPAAPTTFVEVDWKAVEAYSPSIAEQLLEEHVEGEAKARGAGSEAIGEDPGDPLGPAKGIALGIVLGIAAWSLIVVVGIVIWTFAHDQAAPPAVVLSSVAATDAEAISTFPITPPRESWRR